MKFRQVNIQCLEDVLCQVEENNVHQDFGNVFNTLTWSMHEFANK